MEKLRQEGVFIEPSATECQTCGQIEASRASQVRSSVTLSAPKIRSACVRFRTVPIRVVHSSHKAIESSNERYYIRTLRQMVKV